MFENKLIHIMQDAPPADSLWRGAHKIPWDDPQFSQRMLQEHLSQDHQLASRKSEAIAQQAAWITGRLLGGGQGRVLDLGCGPGLYAPHLTGAGQVYQGIDFGPASIEYAQRNFANKGQCQFRLGDVREADYGGPHDLVMMLYGEINVFSRQDCARILVKAYEALKPGGRILLEAHTSEAVAETGQGAPAWYKSPGGLFSDEPHMCLTENHWYEEQAVSMQIFHVVDLASATMQTYRSTMQAYDEKAYARALTRAGFGQVEFHRDWPSPSPALMAMSAIK